MEPRHFPIRACPVCGSQRFQPLFRQSFAQLSATNLMEGYTVVICDDCGAGFANDIPPQSVFDDYYRDLSKYEDSSAPSAVPPPVDQKFRDVAVLIQRFLPGPGPRILEIGSASGGLLKALRDLGCSDVFGLDPSPACVAAASRLYGIPGVVGTVFTAAAHGETYDFLILTGVMEHIRDLDRAIDQFRLLMRESGRIYLEVPDASRYDATLDAPYQEFSVEHINFFSRSSLVNLMQARGFRTIEAGCVVRSLHEVTVPCTYGVFEYASVPQAIEPDTETRPGLSAYIAGCAAEDARIRRAIDESLEPGEQMVVWGVGTHTLRLLSTGGLDPSRIALFVDSNPKYQDQELRGVAIVDPARLQSRREPILVSSRSSQQAIHKQIRHGLRLRNPLILLYGREPGGHREELDPVLDTSAGASASLE
uniref:Methyltransferase type 12 n=1 Tax=Solibacter usitatus (strain Ellin6076) TaxID=234267 RepID=Q025U1_SOLUE